MLAWGIRRCELMAGDVRFDAVVGVVGGEAERHVVLHDPLVAHLGACLARVAGRDTTHERAGDQLAAAICTAASTSQANPLLRGLEGSCALLSKLAEKPRSCACAAHG